mmetsp:Transcript_3730/g.23434  ORF Transcript_3730/g.23434 Transcript_3730/m.23434 type:complete len:656 (-) Transcript_3730:2855-4822(-)
MESAAALSSLSPGARCPGATSAASNGRRSSFWLPWKLKKKMKLKSPRSIRKRRWKKVWNDRVAKTQGAENASSTVPLVTRPCSPRTRLRVHPRMLGVFKDTHFSSVGEGIRSVASAFPPSLSSARTGTAPFVCCNVLAFFPASPLRAPRWHRWQTRPAGPSHRSTPRALHDLCLVSPLQGGVASHSPWEPFRKASGPLHWTSVVCLSSFSPASPGNTWMACSSFSPGTLHTSSGTSLHDGTMEGTWQVPFPWVSCDTQHWPRWMSTRSYPSSLVHHQANFGRKGGCLDTFHAMVYRLRVVMPSHEKRQQSPTRSTGTTSTCSELHPAPFPSFVGSACRFSTFLRCRDVHFRRPRTRASSRGELDDTCACTSFVRLTTTMAATCARSTTTWSHVHDDDEGVEEQVEDAVERIRDLRCATRRGEATRAYDVRCATTRSEVVACAWARRAELHVHLHVRMDRDTRGLVVVERVDDEERQVPQPRSAGARRCETEAADRVCDDVDDHGRQLDDVVPRGRPAPRPMHVQLREDVRAAGPGIASPPRLLACGKSKGIGTRVHRGHTSSIQRGRRRKRHAGSFHDTRAAWHRTRMHQSPTHPSHRCTLQPPPSRTDLGQASHRRCPGNGTHGGGDPRRGHCRRKRQARGDANPDPSAGQHGA